MKSPTKAPTPHQVLEHGGASRHCVKVSGAGEIRITLAWSDPHPKFQTLNLEGQILNLEGPTPTQPETSNPER